MGWELGGPLRMGCRRCCCCSCWELVGIRAFAAGDAVGRGLPLKLLLVQGLLLFVQERVACCSGCRRV